MARQYWGAGEGIPEGSDFTLIAYLELDGAVNTTRITSSGTFTLTISDSVLNSGTALLADRASDSFTASTGLAKWEITDSESSAWEAGFYEGDVKLVDSAGIITYWPVAMNVREARD